MTKLFMPHVIKFTAAFFIVDMMEEDTNCNGAIEFKDVMSYAINHVRDYESRYYRKALELGIDDELLCAGGESYLVDLEIATFKLGVVPEDIPINVNDTIKKEFSCRYGRADIVVFHIDGTVTVIEAKDGKRGYGDVVSGIGQVTLYATQIAGKAVGIKKIRRCLLWSTTGDSDLDETIKDACISADVIPMLRKATKETRAYGFLARKYGRDEMAAIDEANYNIDVAFCEFMIDLMANKETENK